MRGDKCKGGAVAAKPAVGTVRTARADIRSRCLAKIHQLKQQALLELGIAHVQQHV